jgi:putative ABC transport system ATP-binding protein
MAELLTVARGLVKRYRKGSEDIRPVNGLDLEVREGELISIRGPSGSGKSTLLHLLGGLDRPDEGSVSVGGVELTRLKEAELCKFRNENVGFVFQVFHLIPVLTAFENVEIPLRLFPIPPARRREQVELALKLVGLSDRMKHRPNELSGGQQQRVAIARAIATDPKLLLADEPTGDLDERTGEEIMDLFLALHDQQKKTIVMVTHDLAKAALAERQLYFHQGKVIDAKDAPAPRQRAPRQRAAESADSLSPGEGEASA